MVQLVDIFKLLGCHFKRQQRAGHHQRGGGDVDGVGGGGGAGQRARLPFKQSGSKSRWSFLYKKENKHKQAQFEVDF